MAVEMIFTPCNGVNVAPHETHQLRRLLARAVNPLPFTRRDVLWIHHAPEPTDGPPNSSRGVYSGAVAVPRAIFQRRCPQSRTAAPSSPSRSPATTQIQVCSFC